MEKEIWLPIKHGGGKKEVSSLGRVRNSVTKRILRQSIGKDGYPSITFWVDGKNSSFRVHRLVAEAFIPNPKLKSTVNHKDFNKTNNRVSNLEWNSTEENISHYFENGFKGKVSDDDVFFIRKNIEVIGARKISKILMVNELYVLAIANGTCKRNVHKELIREKKIPFPKRVKKYTQEGVLVCEYNSISEAARNNGLRLSHVQRVLTGERKAAKGVVFKYA